MIEEWIPRDNGGGAPHDELPGVSGWMLRFRTPQSDKSIFDSDYSETCFEGFREMFDSDWGGKELRFVQHWKDQLDSNLKLPGLSSHNRSIDLLNQAWVDADAVVWPGEKKWQKDHVHCYEIHFRGKQSGISYKIDITYDPKAAKILASRFDEIEKADLVSSDDSVILGFLKTFKDLFGFRVSWYNPLDSWEFICIEPRDYSSWPGDHIVSLIYSLRDDLNSALHHSMDTLRRNIRTGIRVAWAEGESDISIYRMHCYLSAYDHIDYSRGGGDPRIPTGEREENGKRMSREFMEFFSDPEFPASQKLKFADTIDEGMVLV